MFLRSWSLDLRKCSKFFYLEIDGLGRGASYFTSSVYHPHTPFLLSSSFSKCRSCIECFCRICLGMCYKCMSARSCSFMIHCSRNSSMFFQPCHTADQWVWRTICNTQKPLNNKVLQDLIVYQISSVGEICPAFHRNHNTTVVWKVWARINVESHR